MAMVGKDIQFSNPEKVVKPTLIKAPSVIKLGSYTDVLAVPSDSLNPQAAKMRLVYNDGVEWRAFEKKEEILLGREVPGFQVKLPDSKVSRIHAAIDYRYGEGYYLKDNNSTNGTSISKVKEGVNGQNVVDKNTWVMTNINNQIGFDFGGSKVDLKSEGDRFYLASPAGKYEILDGVPVTLGRDPTSTINLQSGSVSRQHAVLIRLGDKLFIRDNGSSNGTRIDVALPVIQKKVQNEIEKNNQYEAAGVSKPSLKHGPGGNQDRALFDSKTGYLGVVDGAGGHLGGREAAIIAHDAIRQVFSRLSAKSTAKEAELAIRETWKMASTQMGIKALEDRNLGDMKAVALVAKIITENDKRKVVIGQAGDSRLSVVKEDGSILPLTKDEDMGPGILSNVITNCIDRERVNPTITTYEIAPGDLMLLATCDGVHDKLDKNKVANLVRELRARNASLQEIAAALVNSAQAAPGHIMDDATAVLMKLR